jgi:O-succinylbenzoic acid--CoA ligase
MLADYPYRSIVLNNRTLSLEDICNGRVDPINPFETSTLQFIAQWFARQDSFIQTTSGSTGAPKTIAIARHQMIASAMLTKQVLDLRKGDSALLCLDPAYIAGKMMLVRSFVTGMRIVAANPVADPFFALSPNTTIDFAALVPLQLTAILSGDSTNSLRTTRQVIVGGGEAGPDLEQQVQVLPTRVYATYGMTETISHVALRPLNGPQASEWYKALPGIDIRQDERQCCVISWDLLAEDVVTNDIIEIRGRNSFRWLGRWDNVINSGGLKIIPEDLESRIAPVLAGLGLHMPFFVGAAPDQTLGQRIILALAGSLEENTIKALWQAMQASLARHEVPREIRLGESFEYTETGKIRRHESLHRLQSMKKPSDFNDV